MSANEIMQEIDRLPEKEPRELFVLMTRKIVGGRGVESKAWLGKNLFFEEACDVVFRENRELLSALTK